MNTLKLKFPSGVNIDTETKDKLIDNGWKIEYCELTPPTPKWLPIDKDNLPDEPVLVMCKDLNEVDNYTGFLQISNVNSELILCWNGRNWNVSAATHYIPLTDLVNLPIAE